MRPKVLFVSARPHAPLVHPGAVVSPSAREQGQAMIEFALTLGIFILLMIGLIGLTVVFFGWLTTASAAREGARYIVGDPTATAQEVQDHICTTSFMLGGSAAACASNVSAGNLVITISPATVPKLPESQVSVRIRFRVPVPTIRAVFLNGGGITFLGPVYVESLSVMRIE